MIAASEITAKAQTIAEMLGAELISTNWSDGRIRVYRYVFRYHGKDGIAHIFSVSGEGRKQVMAKLEAVLDGIIAAEHVGRRHNMLTTHDLLPVERLMTRSRPISDLMALMTSRERDFCISLPEWPENKRWCVEHAFAHAPYPLRGASRAAHDGTGGEKRHDGNSQ